MEYIGMEEVFLMALNFHRNQGNVPAQGGMDAGKGTEFLNQPQSLPSGMSRFLSKKGINSPADLEKRIQQNPMGFLKKRG